MQEEFDTTCKNETWELTSRPLNKNVIGVKWVYRTKFNADGSVFKYKVKLVVKGYAQFARVEFGKLLHQLQDMKQ